MKKKTIIWILIAVTIVAAVVIYFVTKEKKVAVIFSTVKTENGYITKSVTATGTLQPLDTVSVGAQVSGLVKTIYADFNSVVKKGQLLAQIEPSIIKAQTQESKATLANAKSNLDYQQVNFERQKKLFNLGAISQADYQLATNQYESAKAAVDNATAQLKITLQTLSYTNIYSPVNGVVLNRNVSAGQTIASSFSAPTLFVIAKDLTKMQVRANVDEADIGGVLAGQNVSFTVDAFPDDIFRGTVQEILLHATISSSVVTYTTLINVNNQNLKLKPGMTASINIYSEEDSNALLIPSRALTFKPDSALLSNYTIIKAEKKIDTKDTFVKATDEKDVTRQSYVWVKTGDTLTQKLIITGLNDDTNVKVINGLSPQDEVVTSAVSGNDQSSTDVTQKSPFMPTMNRKKTTTAPKK
ncbi:MAG TPA: efflux RND transporter periplasmic adaptor subunit [Panacibacter sp.]|nr:efflux RND transporter periplasmic adaptor subunit [Panacibacter sp.]